MGVPKVFMGLVYVVGATQKYGHRTTTIYLVRTMVLMFIVHFEYEFDLIIYTTAHILL